MAEFATEIVRREGARIGEAVKILKQKFGDRLSTSRAVGGRNGKKATAV